MRVTRQPETAARRLRNAVQREYSRIAQRYPARGARLRAAERMVRADLDWLGLRPGEVALDLGCGTGLYTLEMTRRTAGSTFGVDLTEAMLRRALMFAAHSPPDIQEHPAHFLAADAHHLPFSASALDLLLCAFCFPHFAEPARVVSEISRVVRPGGRVALFEVVADCALVNRLERLRERVYTRVRTTAEFLALFARTGFRLERFRLSLRRGRFRNWAAASNLPAGSPALKRARRLLLASARTPGNPLRCRRSGGELEFAHPVAAFLFRRNRPDLPRISKGVGVPCCYNSGDGAQRLDGGALL